jgi:hypothetical protein
MTGQVDILGVYIPALLPLMVIAYLINVCIRSTLARVGFYRFVWHRSIFDLGMYAVVLSAVFLLIHQLVS